MIRLRKTNESYSGNEFYEPSEGCEFDGYYITASELEQRERAAFEKWLVKEIESTQAKIELGKGTWPQSDYVKDEDWARLFERHYVLHDVLAYYRKLGEKKDDQAS